MTDLTTTARKYAAERPDLDGAALVDHVSDAWQGAPPHRALIAAALTPNGHQADPGADRPEASEQGGKKSAATVLVGLAGKLYEFGVSPEGETFGVPRVGPKVVAMLRGGRTSLRAQLARRYFKLTSKAAPQQALADALLVVEGIAQDHDAQELHLRVATHGGALWLDLGDDTGRAVRITSAGWTVETEAPVLFKRTALMAPLPEPVRGGDVGELWQWLNVTEADRAILLAWLLCVLREQVPHPILGLLGQQGTGKTTAERIVVSVLDPSPVPTRKPPRDADSWVSAAAGSWVVGLDNLSTISDWLSDSLCRAVTGDGDVRRKLYTDGDHHVVAFRRCIVITGIDLGAIRGDLAERMLPIELAVIDGATRLEEADLWPGWDQAHARILGAVLDLAAGMEGVLPSLHLETKPRMADFARVLAAVDHLTGSAGMERYIAKQATAATEALTGDPFLVAMNTLFTPATKFKGTSAELLELVPTPERPPKGWPANARALTTILRRQAPPMRKAGWVITDDGAANKDGVTIWTIARPEKARNPSPPSPPDPPTGPGGGEAGKAGNEYGPSQGDDDAAVDRLGAAFLGAELVTGDLAHLPLDQVGTCRHCRASTTVTVGGDPVCRTCRGVA